MLVSSSVSLINCSTM